MRVMVVGGYGNFGSRICRALAVRGMEVIASSRDPERGHKECSFDATIAKARIDIHDPNLADTFRTLAPDIVIHCAGPFQDQNYHVAETSLAAGAHYIDLADARSFVAHFPAKINSAALAANLLAVTGASTLPALSSTVIDALAPRFATLNEIQISIVPAQRSPRGTATLHAVFSYIGKPFIWLKDGAWTRAHGWQELQRLRFSGLGTRWAAACDVPDLEVLPTRYPGIKTVQFRASLEFGWEHFALATIAGLRRIGIPTPLERWAAPIDRIISTMNRFGGENGGMLVSLTGTRLDGRQLCLEWHLTADWMHGPEIPCMAAILLVHKLSQDTLANRGATICMGLLTLDDFASEFSRWNIQTSIEETLL